MPQYQENYIPGAEDRAKEAEIAAAKDKMNQAERLQALKDRLAGLPEDDVQTQAIRNEIEAIEGSSQE